MRRILVSVALATVVLVSPVRAQQLLQTDGFGTLAGKVTLLGELPKEIDLTNAMKEKDAKCCLSAKMKPEEKIDLKWIVDPKTKAVANVMVWVVPPKGKYFPTPDKFKDRAKEVVTIDQPHCQYLPRIAAYQPVYIDGGKKVETGQKLVFKNTAKCGHNVRVLGNGVDNDGFNKTLPAGTEIEEKLNPQRLPLSVQCDIHPWMAAKLFVFDHPYYALTDAKGNFEIPMVPAGAEITVMAWHEGVGYLLMRKEGDKSFPGHLKTIEKGKTMTLDLEIKSANGN